MTDQTILGLLAEFDSPAHLLSAAKKMAAAGYSNYDCHSPFPIHGMDEAMRLKRSPLGWIVGIMAIAGALGGLLLQGWTSSIAYPLIISGKPFFSYPAFLPVAFGLAVLAGAISALVGMIWLNKLPKFYHDVFYSDRFNRFSSDGFFLSVESQDALFSIDQTKVFLQNLGGKHIEILAREKLKP
jgi:hypothetical protein